MKRLAAALLFCLIGSNAWGATPDTVAQAKQQYMQKTPWSILMALDPSDPSKLIPILIDALGRFTVTVVGAMGSVDQGASGDSADPWFFNLRNAAGTEIGTAAVPVGVSLFDGAGILFGTAANPFGIQGTTAAGVAFSDNPVVAGVVDSSGITRALIGGGSGIISTTNGFSLLDGTTNVAGLLNFAGSPTILQTMGGYLFNGASLDLKRGSIAFGQEMEVMRFPDNEPFDMSQVGGNAISSNAGNADAGTQRIVIATDQAELPVSLNASSIDPLRHTEGVTSAGVEELVAAQGGITYRVLGWTIAYDGGTKAVGTLHFTGTATSSTIFESFSAADRGGLKEPISSIGAKADTVNTAISIDIDTLTGGGSVDVTIHYLEE